MKAERNAGRLGEALYAAGTIGRSIRRAVSSAGGAYPLGNDLSARSLDLIVEASAPFKAGILVARVAG